MRKIISLVLVFFLFVQPVSAQVLPLFFPHPTLGDLNGDGIVSQSAGNLIKVVYPLPAAGGLQPVAYFTYNNFGQLQTAANPVGVITKYEYDPATGQVSLITSDYGGEPHINASTQFTYDQLGNVISVLDPENHTTSFTYNSLNQLVESIVHGPQSIDIKTKYTYDKNGNLIKLERQANDSATQWQTTEYEYDIIDQLIQVTSRKLQAPSPEDQITQYQYDANGNKIAVTDAENHSTYYYYDEKDLLYKTIDALGSVTEYTYDPNNNLSRIKDANNNLTQYFYDGFDRLIKTVYPDNSYEQYVYDSNSNLISKRTRKGDFIGYDYDSLNRLTAKKANLQTEAEYTYDIGSRLIQVTNPQTSINYTYDNLNRVLRVNEQRGTNERAISYEYNKNGNRTKLTYPDNSFINYSYDSLNRLTSITDQTNSTIASYSYDPLSRRTSLNLANNTQTTYTYDNLNRLTSLNDYTLSAIRSTLSYTYDKVGNRKSKTTTAGTENYTYDNIYQLTQVTGDGQQVTSYSYDKLGNRITAEGKTYTSNNLNQYTSVDSNTLGYDSNGNLLNDGASAFEYDFENRLMRAGNLLDSKTTDYSYDPFGRRISKDVNGVVTYFIWDGDQIIGEYDAAGTLQKKYVYGSGIDEPILMQSGSNKYWYHFEGLGSVTEITDNSGAIKESYTYNIYGQTQIKDENGNTLTQSAIGNTAMFTGRNLDFETGLYFYRARYYSPELGRFLQVDPFDYMDGSNLYKYVRNRPTFLNDPWGYKPGDKYNNQDEAGTSACQDIHNRSVSEGREYGGHIYKNPDGTYSYTPPVKGGKDWVNPGPQPTGSTADYHSHGANDPGYNNEDFSDTDKQDNRNKGTEGYLGTPSGDIKKFSPSENKTSKIGKMVGKKKEKMGGGKCEK